MLDLLQAVPSTTPAHAAGGWWWVWILIGFVILVAIFGFSTGGWWRGPREPRVP